MPRKPNDDRSVVSLAVLRDTNRQFAPRARLDPAALPPHRLQVEIVSGDRASLQATVDRLLRLIQADPNKAQLARESANIQIPYFITLRAGMLAKRTSKNQVTLPKAVVQQVGEADYYDVTAQEGKIILTPVRLQQADAVRTKLDELGLTAADIDEAIAWARRRP